MESYLKILNTKHLTQDELAKRFGKSRSYITNLIGILSLPNIVKDMVWTKNYYSQILIHNPIYK